MMMMMMMMMMMIILLLLWATTKKGSVSLRTKTMTAAVMTRARATCILARENEGTERKASGQTLGICHVHESYF